MRTLNHRVLALIILLACFTAAGFAQTSGAGTITGEVRDPSGASVPGAAIVLHNTDTGVDRTLQSNDSGIYVVTFVPPGHYEITASKEGFAKVLRKDLTLQVGQTLTIDFAMSVQTAPRPSR